MRYIKTFEKYYVEDDNLYHYTSLNNAIQIIKSNFLKSRRREAVHKYTTNPYIYNNYGFVSFTEDEMYHDNTDSSLICECRFVFSESKLEKDYELVKHDANEASHQSYLYDNDLEDEDLDDMHYEDIGYFGDEMELRIYSDDIPLKKYLNRLEIFDFMESHSLEKFKNLVKECEDNGIKYIEIEY